MINFAKKHLWIIIIVILLILFPQSLSDQARLNLRVIITGIGIDFVDDQYEITAQIVMPANGSESGGISAHINYVSTKSKSISDGIQEVSYKIGKIAELSHTEFILIGESMQNHNIASCLDYIFRNYKFKNNLMILGCTNSAKDEIHKTTKLELSVALALQKIYIANETSLNGVAKTYVEFINDSNSVAGTSVIDSFQLTTGQSDAGESSLSGGSSSSQNSSGGGSSSSSSGESTSSSDSQTESGNKERLSPLLFYKNGKLVGKIEDKEAILGYYFFRDKSRTGNLSITDFTYGEAQNANINLRIDQMSKHHKLEFCNGKPVHTITISINEAKIDEISSAYYSTTSLYKTLDKTMQQEIINKACSQIENYLNKAYKLAQELNFDIFQTANLAKIKDEKKWQNFIKNLSNKEEYIKDISVVVKADIKRIS